LDILIAGLVIVSACLHPLRDVVIKGVGSPESAYFGVILVWVLLAGTHAWMLDVSPLSAAAEWPLILASATGLFFYYVGVQTTMARGDLSVYYPIVRSSPLFVVIAGFVFLDHRYSLGLLTGIGLTLAGAFFLQYRHGARLFHEPLTVGAAALAMAGHGVTALADAQAMQSIEPMVLMLWVNILLVLFCGTYFALRRPAHQSWGAHLLAGWRAMPARIVAAGALSYFSYLLILISFQLGGDVAAVSALRQASIPISVVLGGMYLSEKGIGKRFGWSAVLAIGIVIIILSRDLTRPRHADTSSMNVSDSAMTSSVMNMWPRSP
jgi:drug/metabolite transporter (DMT)-like permease